jgi:hypothetical protein
MIEVRRIGEGDPLDFEVVVREGSGENPAPCYNVSGDEPTLDSW